MAFQIIDDVLDFTGQPAEVGKPLARDLQQGLITLPTIYYYESEPGDADLQPVLEGFIYDENRLARLTMAIRQSDAIDKSLVEAGDFIARALDLLEDLPATVERQALEDLAKYIIRRHK
jgi:geranylgeranyl pyrophosphate synthase